MQYDVLYAFFNLYISRKIYVKTLYNFQQHDSGLLRVLRALYSLKELLLL
jgi:hypothetical protein